MCTFYHSGLEAYCKSAAEMLGDGGLVLNLCQDLFPDRTGDALARTWCLSNQRRGPANRMSIFEDWWLDDGEHEGTAISEYRAEALTFYQIQHPEEDHPAPQVPAGGFLTITPKSPYEEKLRNAIDEADCERIAQNRCMRDSVYRCVDEAIHAMIHDHDAEVADGLAGVKSILRMECFKELFKEHIIPAIEHGFLCERYKATDIEWFKNIFMESINALPDKVSDYSDDNIKQTLVLLVSALIYGPSNGLVRIGYWDDPTRNAMADDAEALHAELEPRPGAAITNRLTQVLDTDCRYTGFSEVFASSVAVFVGRCAEPEDYLERCRDVFKDHPEVLAALNEREKIAFPISPTSTYVSWYHALLLYLEGNYYIYDIGSTNGTSIKGLEEEHGVARVVEDVSVALPGDWLTFGAPGGADDAAAYQHAVTLLMTRDLGRSMQLG